MPNRKGFMDIAFLGFLVLTVLLVIGVASFGVTKSYLAIGSYDNSEKFTYTYKYNSAPLEIGDKVFASGTLEYICGNAGKKIDYPEPRQDCWKIKVNFAGTEFDATPGNLYQLNDHLRVSVEPDATVYFDEETQGFRNPGDWTVLFRFRLDADKLLEAQDINYPKEVMLNSGNEAAVQINNKLASFDESHSGLYTRTRHGLLSRSEPWQNQKLSLSEGINTYLLQPDTSEYGTHKLDVQAYFMIDADRQVKILQETPQTLEFTVTDQIKDTSNANIEPLDKQGFFSWLLTWIADLFRK